MLSEAILHRLNTESFRRISGGVLTQMVLCLLIWILFNYESEKNLLVELSLIGCFSVAAFRGALYLKFRADPAPLLKFYPWYLSTVLLNGFLWGLSAASVIAQFGINSVESVLVIFIINGIMTATVHSLAASIGFQRKYIFLIFGPILFSIVFYRGSQIELMTGLLLGVGALYFIGAGKKMTKGLIAFFQNEELLRTQKDTFQNIVNSVPGFVAMLGRDGEWAQHSTSFDHFKNSAFLKSACEKFLASNATMATEQKQWSEHGENFAFILSFHAPPGAHDRMILVGLPANELIDVKNQLDMQRSKAEFSSRLATLGEMAAGIAHEINNPLAVILGNASQISRSLQVASPDVPKAVERVEKIIKTTYRISKIIQGLRSFSRQGDRDPFTLTPVSQLMEDTLELCREKFFRNNISLVCAPVPNLSVPMRNVQVSQVLINLLNNAYDAVKDLETKKVEVRFQVSEEKICIQVVDTGPGVPPQIAAKIFEPFFTTKQVGEGTGLGLSISRGIMQEHQGEITIVPDARLTIFEMSLPRHHREEFKKSA